MRRRERGRERDKVVVIKHKNTIFYIVLIEIIEERKKRKKI